MDAYSGTRQTKDEKLSKTNEANTVSNVKEGFKNKILCRGEA